MMELRTPSYNIKFTRNPQTDELTPYVFEYKGQYSLFKQIRLVMKLHQYNKCYFYTLSGKWYQAILNHYEVEITKPPPSHECYRIKKEKESLPTKIKRILLCIR